MDSYICLFLSNPSYLFRVTTTGQPNHLVMVLEVSQQPLWLTPLQMELVVMELTTSDATSAIKKGINTENLDWQVFLPSSVKNPEAVTLEVIPLTGDNVYLVMQKCAFRLYAHGYSCDK